MSKMSVFVVLQVIVALATCSFAQDYENPFICDDGIPIDREWHCDGFPDCPDESDEQNCVQRCTTSEFACVDGSDCLPRWKVCNRVQNCLDNSDEDPTMCRFDRTSRNCTEDEFRCTNNGCVRLAYRCDGDNDCTDGSDEDNCVTGPPRYNCNSNQFECEGSHVCIPRIYTCDGEVDCFGEEGVSSDEMDCENFQPDCTGLFNCSNGRCVNIHNMCNGDDDCKDGSDEEDCPALRCEPNTFRCVSEGILTCIPNSWLCDGEPDCDDHSDEALCSRACLPSQFQCTTSGMCIDLDRKCDGNVDCSDSSDEYVCPFPPPPVTCRGNQFPCLDQQQCLEAVDVCDGVPHCVDSSDENELCNSTGSCDVDNGGCQHTCHHLSGGRRFCSCRHGYMLNSTDFMSCYDIDECSHPDTCSQLCNNTEGSYMCSCVEGYQYLPTGNCKAIGPEAKILFANRVDIRKVTVNGVRKELLIKRLQYAIGIDYHYQLGYMFWTDLYSDDIKRATLNGTNVTTIIRTGLSAPDGLAVDWVNNKLYWTDVEKGYIEVAELDGSKRKRLFSSNLEKPRAIVVHPALRYLFWTDWGNFSKIERSSMDGSQRLILHSEHISWPNALTIDFPTNTIYWADAKLHIIESSDVNGRNRRPVLTAGVLHPFGMTVFENRLYWSDWNTKAIVSTGKSVGRNTSEVMNWTSSQEAFLNRNVTDVHTDLFNPMDLHVVHPVLQPSSNNPCGLDNGGCVYMCLLSSVADEGYSCSCPTGIKLAPGGKNCQPQENFLLFARRTELDVISLDVPEISIVTLPLSDLMGAQAVETDSETSSFFWSDEFHKTISTAAIDGSNQSTIISTGLGTPKGLAVDWLSRKLYWTNNGESRDSLEVSELDGSNRAIFIYGDIEKPQDVVVHPEAGILFWSDLGVRPKIERVNLDGSNRTVILSTGLKQPYGLAIDRELERLYWCDPYFDVIEYADFEGNSRTVLVRGLSHPFSIALHGNHLYWTDLSSHSIQRADKDTGGNHTTIATDIQNIQTIQIFSRNKTIRLNTGDRNGSNSSLSELSPCSVNNGGCSHLCLTRPSTSVPGQLQAVCVCPTGRRVMDDGLTCFDDVQDFLLFPSLSTLHQISLDTPLMADVPLPVQNFRAASSVDVDIIYNEVYWTDRLEATIFRANLSGGQPRAIISTDLITPEAIAIDWIGRTMFWADSGAGHIEVSDLNGHTRRILVKENLTQVVAIAMDTESRTLFWIDAGDNTRPPKIESSAMDGSKRKVIISEHLGTPRAITVDYSIGESEGRIYWTDQLHRRIESASLNGSERRAIEVFEPSSGVTPFGIAVYGDYVYWTDTSTNSVHRILKSNDTESEEMVRDLPDVSHLTLIKKSDLAKRGLSSHPCKRKEICSHLCLPNWSEQGFVCSCSTGIRLKNNNTCKNLPDKFVVLAASNARINKVPMVTPGSDSILTVKGNYLKPVAIGHILTSPDDGTLFFTDIDRHKISSMSLNGSNFRDVLSVGISTGMAVDWLGKLLYWTDSLHDTIEVARLDGSGRKVLINNGLELPRGITLLQKIGLMFWTDWGRRPAIVRAKMDGTSRATIISTGIVWPNGITVDHVTKLVYWVDAKLHRMERCNLNGLFRMVLLRDYTQNVQHPFAMVIDTGYLYWSDWFASSVLHSKLDRSGDLRGQHVIIANVTHRNLVYGFTVVNTLSPRPGELNARRDMALGPCAVRNGGCTSMHICLPIDGSYRTCACPDNLVPLCTEYQGFKLAPRPYSPTTPLLSTATTPTPTTKATTPTTVSTSPININLPGQNGGGGGSVTTTTGQPTDEGTTDTADAEKHFVSSTVINDETVIIITFAVVTLVVTVAIITVIICTVMWFRRQKSKERLLARRNEALKRLQFTNPNYISMGKKVSCSSSFCSTTSSKMDGVSLLPKQNNTYAERPIPPRRSKNFFVEEKESFSMPPLKPPPSCIPVDSVNLENPPTIPLKAPRTIPLEDEPPLQKPPPPIPPKTYMKLTLGQVPVPTATNVVTETDIVMETQVIMDRECRETKSKGVKFHSDVKFPNEIDPPPIPRRGEVRDSPTVPMEEDAVAMGIETVPKESDIISTETPTVAMVGSATDSDRSSLKTPETESTDDDNRMSEERVEEVAILDASGVRVGEIIHSPMEEEGGVSARVLHSDSPLQLTDTPSTTTSEC